MLWYRKVMNPFEIPLVVLPAVITIYASFVRRRWVRLSLLLVATVVFWVMLQLTVDWAYSHPFDPDDGGPRTFAFLLGWLLGLVLVITPVYWTSKGIQWIWSRRKG